MKIALDEDSFVRNLAREIATLGVRPVDAIERLLAQHLARSLKSAFGTRLIKEPTPRIGGTGRSEQDMDMFYAFLVASVIENDSNF